ncbi:uncharacterized protein P174DRAFT_444517 [Aspergillus novofumigatus IBT 16806]|uniref:Uncharacterized protein n=1 Tax=Aspergillus novofumigatus (strain IBT 16806) TaxID=1392255 RepID=A0A2I1BZI8_ASPN1|nr:uncharacterized protein P174DRAFT_444517 [Aspergillus novofumigatus IBT 16806]PKX90774.1 hypothetical protein P174DRAFT_444517 [Aspergillus novofumigatus IBT 16806]
MAPDSQTTTVLLSSDWEFPLATDSALERVPMENLPGQTLSFPPLSGLLDALIESWLDGPSDEDPLLLHLAVQFNYLYEYAPALKERSFVHGLIFTPENLVCALTAVPLSQCIIAFAVRGHVSA